MTATLTIHAPEISKAEMKARRKAEKKRHNSQLEALGMGLNNVLDVLFGVQDRIAQARMAVAKLDPSAPSQPLSDYLNQLDALMARGVEMAQEQGKPAQEAVAEHFFPGRAAKWAAEDEDRYQDQRYAQQERNFGA